MKFQKASIKLVRSVQNSQIHLKKYRDSQAKQKNFTCLHHTNLSSIDYWITMTISTFATSLSSPLNHERNNHRQILQSWHQIGGLRFRVIFVKILGLNKKGPNRRSKWTTTNEIPKSWHQIGVVSAKFTNSPKKVSRLPSRADQPYMFTSHKPITHWLLNRNDHKHFRNFVGIII